MKMNFNGKGTTMIDLNHFRKLAARLHAGYLIIGLLVLVLTAFGAQAGAVFTSLYSFSGTNDGAYPHAGLVQGSDGSFYGTTELGGTNNLGTVFKITSTGALTSLYSFTGTNDGANPYAGLVQGSDGNFYGTTGSGGTNNLGTVFKITSNGALTSLYSFTGTNDGANPYAGLVQGSDGCFYGTTQNGGTNDTVNGGDGTVFKISTNGALTSLYSFDAIQGRYGEPLDGAYPYAGLVLGSDGNFYGTTVYGGLHSVGYTLFPGTVFQISNNGALTSLYSFTRTDGAYPQAGLVQGSNGNFYGTTGGGGTNGNYGTVFQISSNGALTSLHSFTRTDGANPQAGLVLGSDGYFYGTTAQGGTNNTVNGGDGTVFKISTNGALTSLYSFSGTNDGRIPLSGLVQGSDGSFYGTTQYGGTNNLGTVFRLTIQPPLTMTLSGANVILSWPTNYPGWYLQKTVNLGATGGWLSVTLIEPPIIVNGQFAVTLPITSPQRGYYRLSSP